MSSANHFGSIERWKKHKPDAYKAAKKNGWLRFCLTELGDERGYSVSECIASTQSYISVERWKKAKAELYEAAKEFGW